jgi:hypothetical protein
MPRPDQPHTFAARIQKIWIMRCVDLPRDICKSLRQLVGEDAKHIPVHGWIEGLPMKSTLVPAGAGRYRLHVHSRIWRKLRIDAGATVEVTLLLDTEPRDPVLPPELAAGLAETPRALAAFNAETAAMRRQTVQFFDAAKRPATREKRIQQIAKAMLERAARKAKRNKRKKL